MFYFRINKLKIFNNYVGRLIKRNDVASIQIISFITTENEDLPALNLYLKENDAEKKDVLLRQMVETVAARRILTRIDHIKDNQQIMFGDTGFVLYQSKEIPQDFNWQMAVFLSREKFRDRVKIAESVVNDSDFKSFSTALATLIGAASNPIVTASVEIGKFITSAVLKSIAERKDLQLGLVYMSLNKTEHYPHGERKKDDVIDLTGNMTFDYSVFGF